MVRTQGNVSKTYKNAATIATGTSIYIDPTGQITGTRDYMGVWAPFNSLFVSNEDSNTIEVYPNDSTDRKIVLPQGATRSLLNEQFQYLRIKNIGSGTVSVGNVTARIEKIRVK